MINLEEYESIKSDWIALYADAENLTYFDRFGIECILKET